MKPIRCKNCGASNLTETDGHLICNYCNSKFYIEASDAPQKGMGQSLNADIDNLLKKCKTDPKNAKRYANLILDIDPTNKEALKYL